MTATKQDSESQLEKFKQTAREVETDDSEEAFDRALRRVAKAPKAKAGKPEHKPK